MLNQMKIRKKLTLSFILIGLFSVVVGTFGLVYINKTNDHTVSMYDHHLMPTTYLLTVQKNFAQIANDYSLLLYENEPSKTVTREKEIKTLNDENQALVELYGKMSLTNEEKTLYDQFQKELVDYRAVRDQMSNLISQNNLAEALVLIPSFNSEKESADKTLQDLVTANRKEAESERKDSVSDLKIASLIITLAGIMSLLLAGISGWAISSSIGKPLIRLVKEADKLAEGNLDIQITSGRTDEVGELMTAFGKMADHITLQAEAARKIAEGDLKIQIIPKSENDILGASMAAVVDMLNELAGEVGTLTSEAVEGRLDTRGNIDKFSGGYRQIIAGFNNTLDAIAEPLRVSQEYIRQMANGEDLEALENNFKGEYAILISNLTMVRESLYAMLGETQQLVAKTVEGELSYRADADRLKGGYAEIVGGINNTLDLLNHPLNVASDYMESIGRGEIPEKITEEYHGEFNKIKNSINSCIDGLGGMVEGRNVLGVMRYNDFTRTVEGTYQGIFEEIAESVNMVSGRFHVLIDLVNNIAAGDLHQLDEFRKIGKRCENDELMPAFTKVLENITALVVETKMLSSSAIEGKLSTRGVPEKFEGEYANVIRGINETLDAVIAPINEASEVLQEMAKGNLQVTMEGDYQGDHAAIKNALNGTIAHMRSYVSEISMVLAGISGGNLDQSITADYNGDFVEIKDSLNNIIASLNQVMGDISEASEQVASGSKQVSDGSQALSQGSAEQASSIEELTASVTEIASQTKKNAVNANQASQLTREARDNAEKGNVQMKEMLNSMEEINESSANISKIIKVIDDIAFQTNILALNAAVEAARAGQHGKGFAVVAEEVRSLAARSASAARETTELIEGSIGKVQAGTKIANETAAALSGIVEGIEQSASLIGGIAEASNEQASGIALINKGIEQVSQVVQNNSATAEESAAASEELSGQAELLKGMVGRFRLRKAAKGSAGAESRLLGSTARPQLKSSASEPRILLGKADSDKY
jgi:methyl-accepting chemotaxis protein